MGRNYVDGEKISRAEAWFDLKEDFTVRKWWPRPFHIYTDVWVNLARIAGVSDREKSQTVGRVFAVGVPLLIVVAVWMKAA